MQRKKISLSAAVLIGSTLFGLFFGAGNLIFPVALGQRAGLATPLATAGLLLTATGFPFLAILALGFARVGSVRELGDKVHPIFSWVFTFLLYLTIGPLFALPRTASTAFEVGVYHLVAPRYQSTALFLFTLLFFAIALFFSLRPAKIMTWVGKILNPLFLLFLAILLIQALRNPFDSVTIAPVESYAQPFLAGFLEGYNTMDLLAALAFGSLVIDMIQKQGVTQAGGMARSLFQSGLVSVVLMCGIYTLLAWLGAGSAGVYGIAENGGQALGSISRHFFGPYGSLFLSATITVACLKTAIGLITACSQAFGQLLPLPLGYPAWCVVVSGLAFLVSNIGLTQLIALAVPVLMLLYPAAISLVLAGLLTPLHKGHRLWYRLPLIGAVVGGIGDMLQNLPPLLQQTKGVNALLLVFEKLPFSAYGMSWLVPFLVCLGITFVGWLLTRTEGFKEEML